MRDPNPRLVVIGAVEFSSKLRERIRTSGGNGVGVVAKQSAGLNSDYCDLSTAAKLNEIPYYKTNDINEKSVIHFLSELQPDYVFCLGWSQLLSDRALKVAKIENIGYHPTKLPLNRGRHPVIWSLVLGLEKTGSTFFFLRSKADSGPILIQDEVLINYEDDAASLIDKLTKKASDQIDILINKIKQKNLKPVAKTDKNGNFWRRRGEVDGKIDFRMQPSAIYNLTRALTRPYVGAHVEFNGKTFKVWRVEEKKMDSKNIEPGKVLAINKSGILVQAGGGCVLLVDHELSDVIEVGSYL